MRSSQSKDGEMRLGLIGQVRPGKSIEWLVPMFQESPIPGTLHIAGQYATGNKGDLERILKPYPEFTNRYLSERDMIAIATAQDYLVMLYEDWDARMEAATLFVAARAEVPVLVYDEGWCGRIVRQYGCGFAIARIPRPSKAFFSALPRRDSREYKEMVEGIRRFRQGFSGQHLRAEFLSKFGLPDLGPS